MKIKSQEKKLLKDVVCDCILNNVSIRLLNANTIRGGAFGTVHQRGKKVTLNFAFNENNDYDTLWGAFLHESCHLDQYLENGSIFGCKNNTYLREIFKKYERVPYLYPDGYMEGKGTKRDGKIYFQEVLKREIDCDLRALKKIDDRKLNIDKKKYIIDSVCYHYSHVWTWKYRKDTVGGIDYEFIRENYKLPTKILTVDEYWDTYDDLNIDYD